MSTKPLTQSPAWKALQAHHGEVGGLHLRELFAADARRGERVLNVSTTASPTTTAPWGRLAGITAASPERRA